MLELLINDISSADYDLCVFERPIIPTPERDVERINVRGRHGSLTKKYAYKDINIPITLNLMTDALKADVRYIKAWLLNGTKLQFSDDTVYYIVNNVVMGDVENEIEEYGLFDIVVNCKPFQYEDSGAITLDINGRDFLMTLTDYIEIDSELGYTYRGTAGMDNKVNGELPILDIGSNTISWTGSVTKIEIKTKVAYL